MANPTLIGIVGDRNPSNPTHLATEAALGHLDRPLAWEWVPTGTIAGDPGDRLAPYGGLIIAPGSPYHSLEGALAAIRQARESGLPVLGTCGGFQHMVVEFARNVLGQADADHGETRPGAARLAITPLSCSLAGQSHPVRVVPGTLAGRLYGDIASPVEPFFCRFGLNPDYRPLLEARGLVVSGFGEDGRERIIELPGHPFYLGTLYVPQVGSRPGAPHPLLAGLAEAVRARA